MVFAGDHSKDRTLRLGGWCYSSGECPLGDKTQSGRVSTPADVSGLGSWVRATTRQLPDRRQPGTNFRKPARTSTTLAEHRLRAQTAYIDSACGSAAPPTARARCRPYISLSPRIRST